MNSDGNVTFDEGDSASTDRNVARLLTGPPRVSPFLADLDPTTGGGVFVNAAADQYVVTWCNVRGFDSTHTRDRAGHAAARRSDRDALCERDYPDGGGGRRLARADRHFRPVDLSAQGTTSGGSGAVGERFSPSSQLDTVALARTFYASHPDNYDQLVIWTDAPYHPGRVRVRDDGGERDPAGSASEVYDFSRDFGSGGRLRSYAIMDFLGKYPDDPTQRFLGENNTLSVLAHEVGHRWLAFFDFRDHTASSRTRCWAASAPTGASSWTRTPR